MAMTMPMKAPIQTPRVQGEEQGGEVKQDGGHAHGRTQLVFHSSTRERRPSLLRTCRNRPRALQDRPPSPPPLDADIGVGDVAGVEELVEVQPLQRAR